MTGRTERDAALDFPGADELIAAGAVPPPSADRIAAVHEALALLAEREAGTTAAPASDAAGTHSVARRAGPRETLAPPEEPLVVIGSGKPPRSPGRRGRLSRRLLVAAAAMAAVITAGVVVGSERHAGDKPESAVTAASFLGEMADVSTAQAPSAPSGKYWTVGAELSYGGQPKKITKTWYGDRTGHTWEIDRNGKATKSAWNVAFWEVGTRRVTWPELDRLPTEPEKLAALFPKTPMERFRQVTELLEESPASPRLRSALFQTVARIPGVKLVPKAADAHGRKGTAITFQVKPVGNFGYSDFCVIDPKTGRILESRPHATPAPAGRTTYVELGWTDRIG